MEAVVFLEIEEDLHQPRYSVLCHFYEPQCCKQLDKIITLNQLEGAVCTREINAFNLSLLDLFSASF